ncbi:LysR family transcriptional regulator [Desulfovibrio aerotolerans]|uniref:LysR family transcriptional regulator n=1 Tax=Solidesulfovibrio aerotolerans TaxID=295255 RepID=A0A7C9MHB7_9BACT|nr:LysR family transcriptional regulator [Solidesulfovibrio aerotolerans]
MPFDLTDMHLFVQVAEEGSITAGAVRAHLALASASARIRSMEDHLGAPLLTRGPRGVSLTQAGTVLLRHARLITRQWEQMQGELADFAQGRTGRVRLLCNTATLTEFLLENMRAYLLAHPNVDIDIAEGLSADIVKAVTEYRADVGIVAQATDVGGLETLPFRRLRIVLVTPPGHPLAQQQGGVCFEQTLEYEFVGLEGTSSIQKYLAAHAARAGKWIHLRVRLRSFEAVCAMVAGGVGVAIIPETAAEHAAKTMDLRLVHLTDAWASRQLTICLRTYADLPAYAKDLIDLIQSRP